MSFVESTPIAVFFIFWALRRGPYSGLVLFFAVIPFGMMAAMNLPAVGNTSVMAYDLVLLTLGFLLLLRKGIERDIGHLLGRGRAGLPLVFFFLYALVATLFFPRIFAGDTEVFAIGRVAGQLGIVSRPLGPVGGNMSQLLRMFLGMLAFAVPAIIMLRRGDTAMAFRAMLVVSVVHASLGLIDIFTQATGTASILQPIRTANYALTLGQNMAGLDRMIGGFPEASSYGYVSLGLFGFWLGYWFHDRTGSRLPLGMMLLFAFLVVRGTSSSAYVGAALLLILFVGMRLRDVGKNGNGRMDQRVAVALTGLVAVIPFVIVGLYVMYVELPGFANFVDRSLLNKLSSNSGIERMSWNIQALRNFRDTLMLGAGLGSVRASNWIAAVLGTTGIIGMFLLVAFLWHLFRMQVVNASQEMQHLVFALKLGLAGCMSRAIVVKATPNLDFVFFAMAGLLAGLVVHTQIHTRAAPVRRQQWQT